MSNRKPYPRSKAVEVITEHLVDDDGMLEIPIDPIALAKQLGIPVSYSRGLEEGVSGVIVKEPDEPKPRIILNDRDGGNRQRFTAAHEVGHYFSRLEDQDSKYGYVDSRDDLSSSGKDPNERWANQFAAELLMPAFAVRKFFADGMSEARLAREFAVSEQAMHYRLRNLGLA